MPQSLPFFFVNQATFTFVFLFLVIYIFSRFVIPAFLEIKVSRSYIEVLL
ncbi:unnamed protein product (mitochondrion) [Sympodiomycopsis kandeliae]